MFAGVDPPIVDLVAVEAARIADGIAQAVPWMFRAPVRAAATRIARIVIEIYVIKFQPVAAPFLAQAVPLLGQYVNPAVYSWLQALQQVFATTPQQLDPATQEVMGMLATGTLPATIGEPLPASAIFTTEPPKVEHR